MSAVATAETTAPAAKEAKRTVEEIKLALDAARKQKRAAKDTCQALKCELMVHPDTIREELRKLRVPEHTIDTLLSDGKLQQFVSCHEKGVKTRMVGAGTAIISQEAWSCNVEIKGQVPHACMDADRWTGEAGWRTDGFAELSEEAVQNAAADGDQALWNLAMEENEEISGSLNECMERALGSLAFARFCEYY
jgi:hypothetical protein